MAKKGGKFTPLFDQKLNIFQNQKNFKNFFQKKFFKKKISKKFFVPVGKFFFKNSKI